MPIMRSGDRFIYTSSAADATKLNDNRLYFGRARGTLDPDGTTEAGSRTLYFGGVCAIIIGQRRRLARIRPAYG
jgi:hypothetical protein